MTKTTSLIANLSAFSKYRTELMGIGIIGVLILHWFGLQHVTAIGWQTIPAFIGRLVFTPGFLFLSGFGLFYSFDKNPMIKEFYIRRILRLFIPFVLISFPFFLISYITKEDETILDLFAKVTTIAYWYKGNYSGMWYVAISMVLYLLYPAIHKIIFHKEKFLMIRVYSLVTISIVINEVLRICMPNYYEKVELGVSMVFMFIIGIYFGYLSSRNRIEDIGLQFSIFFITWIGIILLRDNYPVLRSYYGTIEKLIYMPLLCLIFSAMDKTNILKRIMGGGN